jgi:hypothetical protein
MSSNILKVTALAVSRISERHVIKEKNNNNIITPTCNELPYVTHSHESNFSYYEACLESKDTKVLIMYNIFNLQKRHCE